MEQAWVSSLLGSLTQDIDPLALAEIAEPPLEISRMTGYALGFFFIWIFCAASATLTVYLIRTRHGHPPASR